MANTIEVLYAKFQERHLNGRVVSIHHLQDLQDEIEGHHAKGHFDAEFYREGLSSFLFQPPENLFEAKSIIVMAVPRPQTRVHFIWNGKVLKLTLPPYYAGFSKIPHVIENILTQWLEPEGYHVASARLPLKLLSACSGLSEYGRNNIGYIPGMGSFFQLTAFYSDIPCQEDIWHEPHMMDRCRQCNICHTQCPTNAITPDRFLLHAERCLVFHNERPSGYPFPEWITPDSHNCLVGCMRCQQLCPENKEFIDWFENDEIFSHEETAFIIRGVPANQLPTKTQEKLERLDFLEYLEILPRNLDVFLKTVRK